MRDLNMPQKQIYNLIRTCSVPFGSVLVDSVFHGVILHNWRKKHKKLSLRDMECILLPTGSLDAGISVRRKD